MTEQFNKEEIKDGPLEDKPQVSAPEKSPQGAKQLVEWIITLAIQSRIARNILLKYASDFKLMEGRKRYIFCFFMCVALIFDLSFGALLALMMIPVLVALVIVILRALNVMPEFISFFSWII